MWPADVEAQSYFVLMLITLAIDVGLLWTVAAERRHHARQLSRRGESGARREAKLRAALYDAEARAVRAERAVERAAEQQGVRTFDEHVASVPTLRTWSGPTLHTSMVVMAPTDPEATTYIDREGEATT
jgi:hypothetical protein